MPPARYIFVCDQGHVFSTCDDPTPGDLEHAAVGLVTILRLEDRSYYGTARQWQPILNGELGVADIDGEQTPPYHGPPSYFAESDRFAIEELHSASNSDRLLSRPDPTDAQR